MKQLQALALSAQLGAKEAAFHLGITEQSVKHRTTALYKKLGVDTRWEALSLLGWIDLPESLVVKWEPDPAAEQPRRYHAEAEILRKRGSDGRFE